MANVGNGGEGEGGGDGCSLAELTGVQSGGRRGGSRGNARGGGKCVIRMRLRGCSKGRGDRGGIASTSDEGEGEKALGGGGLADLARVGSGG